MSTQNNSDESVFEVTLTGYEARYELVTLEPVTVFNMRVRYRNETWETSRRVRVAVCDSCCFCRCQGRAQFP